MADNNTSTHIRLREYAIGQQAAPKIDAENGIISDVLLLGFKSRNNASYPQHVMEAALAKYDGAPVFINHTKDGSNPSYDSKAGMIRNPRVTNDGIRGDYHFPPKHRMAEQIVWDASNDPKNFGFSHDADCTVQAGKGERVVTSIDKVYSVDLVSRPATVKGLFEDEQEFATPELRDFAVSGLSALDNGRSLILSDGTVQERKQRLVEWISDWRMNMHEGEIGEAIADDAKAEKLRKINRKADDLICNAMWCDEEYPTIAVKKQRILAVLADWEKELNNLSPPAAGTSVQEETQSMAIDWKEITTESLKTNRPDLVPAAPPTAEDIVRMSEEVKVLRAEKADHEAELVALSFWREVI